MKKKGRSEVKLECRRLVGCYDKESSERKDRRRGVLSRGWSSGGYSAEFPR